MPKVEYSVPYVPQLRNMDCWAASTAMIMGYLGYAMVAADVVAAMAQQYPGDNWDDGASEKELGEVAKVYNLQQVYPVCQDANGWEQWLNDHGPLLIQVPGYHSIVIGGVDPDANTMYVLDPWDGNGWTGFDEMNQRFEAAGDWSNNVYATH
jgi:ABC-type bacteriocin/lantibiotic exporter with double-glycine peptidase domain